MKAKTFYKVGTDVGPEWRWAYSPRQALALVWRELRSRGARTSWLQALDGWTVEEA